MAAAQQRASSYAQHLPTPQHRKTVKCSVLQDERWARFETLETIRLRDVPFPDLGLWRRTISKTHGADGKKAWQKLALRWHPDKFAPRFGAKLEPKDKDAILEKVKEVFQVINVARGN